MKGLRLAGLLNGAVDRCRLLGSDTSGNLAVIFSLALIPIIGLAGVAVDYSRANSARTQMQAALDAAVLDTVKGSLDGTVSDASSAVQTIFLAHVTSTDASNYQVTTTYDSAAGMLAAHATAVVTGRFANLFGMATIPVGVTSATYGEIAKGCVLALNATASGAVSLGGSSSMNLMNCSMFVNSSSNSALSVTGSASLQAYYVGVVGGISNPSSVTTTKPVKTGATAFSDPYASVAMPTVGACDYTNRNVTVSTIDPGVYCGGLSFSSGSTVTLNSGVYIIDQGVFSVGSNDKIRGTGVTIFLTSSTGSNWATVDIRGGADLTLTAPTSGPTAGIVFFGDRRMPASTSFKFVGGSKQSIGGAIYAPKAALSYSGNSANNNTCTQLVADTVTLQGNASVAVNCNGYGTKSIGTSRVVLRQ